MRYPRNAKIFRGQVDLAPLANVLFLLVLFLLLASLIYTPGIPFRLAGNLRDASGTRKVLTIAQNGDILFNGKTNRVDEMDDLVSEFKKLPPQTTIIVNVEANAPKGIIAHVQERAKDLPVLLETPLLPVELPLADEFSGTLDPTVIVAVNYTGQFFFENQLISAKQLEEKLEATVKKTREPLTLLVLADKSVQADVMVQLGALAQKAGIRNMVQAVRPARP